MPKLKAPKPKAHPASMNSRLRNLFENSGISMTALSKESGVPYWPIYRWLKVKEESLKLDHAEQLWEYFTGFKFN